MYNARLVLGYTRGITKKAWAVTAGINLCVQSMHAWTTQACSIRVHADACESTAGVKMSILQMKNPVAMAIKSVNSL